jgi:hypothetical protein
MENKKFCEEITAFLFIRHGTHNSEKKDTHRHTDCKVISKGLIRLKKINGGYKDRSEDTKLISQASFNFLTYGR